MPKKETGAQAVNLGQTDQKFVKEIIERPGGEHLLHCFACGTCTLACPVAEVVDEYSPRKIIRRILLGQKDEVLSDPTIWYCHSCFRCAVHCPQDVKFTHIMQILRQLALEQNYVTSDFAQAVQELDHYTEELRLKLFAELAKNRKEAKQPKPDDILKQVTQ